MDLGMVLLGGHTMPFLFANEMVANAMVSNEKVVNAIVANVIVSNEKVANATNSGAMTHPVTYGRAGVYSPTILRMSALYCIIKVQKENDLFLKSYPHSVDN